MVSPEAIVEISRFLRDDPSLKFEVLSDLTALDWPKEEKIQVVYHLYSYSHKSQIVLKVDLPRDNPKIPTLEGVWKVANWFEREVFDLFGVIFEGHSDLAHGSCCPKIGSDIRCVRTMSSRKSTTASVPSARHWSKNYCAREKI